MTAGSNGRLQRRSLTRLQSTSALVSADLLPSVIIFTPLVNITLLTTSLHITLPARDAPVCSGGGHGCLRPVPVDS